MGDEVLPERKSGCGILNAFFGRNSIWPRRSTSTNSLPTANTKSVNSVRSDPIQKKRRNDPDEDFIDSPNVKNDRVVERPIQNQAPPVYHQVPPVYHQAPPVYHQAPPAYHQNQTQYVTQQNYGSMGPKNQQGYGQARKLPPGTLGISGELESMIQDHQKTKVAGSLVRASSGNVMLIGNLGNLRQPGNYNGNTNSMNTLDYLPRTAMEPPLPKNPKYPTSAMGNLVKKKEEPEKPVSLCRALSTRMDPEELKILGNEDYKNGRFAEALALYDAAISIDPNKASYRSNKSAALTALGQLLDAAFECREAIRIEPLYQRAHNRLATLYVRLGEAERAVYHFKQSGQEADPDAMNKAKKVQFHLSKCTEAKKQRDWNTVLKETGLSISAGADSAPLIFALKAEALLKTNKHQEAIDTMAKGPNFHIDDCTKFFGPVGSASLSIIRAHVHMVAGRFDEAIASAQRALTLDGNNKEASSILRRTRAVAIARSNGNELFKAGKYAEACIAYGEGLNHDPHNAVLLCNRAACRSKLGQYQKAIEDCSGALNVRSGYSKARLRRANCYAKMEKWEACLEDCQMLLRVNPDDEEVQKMLKEAKSRLGREEEEQHTIIPPSTIVMSDVEHFQDHLTSHGLCVVLFFSKPINGRNMELVEELNKKYSSVKFLQVEVEDESLLVEVEEINSLPVFILYKNGSKSKEIEGDNFDLLESSIKYYVNS